MRTTKLEMFGKTKLVPVVTYTNGKADRTPKTRWSKTLWVERGEDYYALMSKEYRGHTVLVVERRQWLKAKECK